MSAEPAAAFVRRRRPDWDALEALRRARRVAERGAELAEYCRAQLEKHTAYVREHLEDMPEVRNWIWPG